MKRYILFAFTAAMSSLSVFGWGQKGHDTTVAIAERHLSKATANSVSNILDGMSPVYWANWLDNASHTPEYAYTKTWHYKNIDAGQKYEDVKPFETGDVVTALREQIATLSDPKSTHDEKNLALKILLHLMGDIHQPMHVGHASDKGGNKTQVQFFNQGSNLHAVWDTKLPNAAHAWTFTEWADILDRVDFEKQRELSSGNIDDWAKQSYEIASQLYEAFPVGSKISYNEIAEWTPVVEQQFLRGGLRLARVLNAIFDPTSKDKPSDF